MLKQHKVYRKRTVRRPTPSLLAIQPHDVAICEFVYLFGAALQGQLQALFFGAKSPAQRRLERLFDAGYLERDVLLRAAGRNPTVYYLGRQGAELIRRESELDVKWHRTSIRLRTDTLVHSLKIVDFWILLLQACERHGFSLEAITERQFRQPGGADRVAVNGRSARLIPDLFFCITHNGNRSLFFLELDRATESLRRYREKQIAYLHYRLSNDFLHRFGQFLTPEQLDWKRREDRRGPSMRVLTVVDTEGFTGYSGQRRLGNIVRSVGHPDVAQFRPARRFWAALLRDLSSENILSKAVWNVRDADERASVLLEEFE